MKKGFRKIAGLILILLSVAFMFIFGCRVIVKNASKGLMFSDVKNIPRRDVGLLLGTSPFGRSGLPNQFFLRRIDAAVSLYEAGKIKHIIISGASQGEDYNEPEEMRKELLSRGIPDDILTLDGEGYRTIISMMRVHTIYGVDSITIISQKFHNERALFLAKRIGINAIGYNAENTYSSKWRILMKVREYLACVKAVFETLLL